VKNGHFSDVDALYTHSKSGGADSSAQAPKFSERNINQEGQ